jgi:hypothetical protein
MIGQRFFQTAGAVMCRVQIELFALEILFQQLA